MSSSDVQSSRTDAPAPSARVVSWNGRLVDLNALSDAVRIMELTRSVRTVVPVVTPCALLHFHPAGRSARSVRPCPRCGPRPDSSRPAALSARVRARPMPAYRTVLPVRRLAPQQILVPVLAVCSVCSCFGTGCCFGTPCDGLGLGCLNTVCSCV